MKFHEAYEQLRQIVTDSYPLSTAIARFAWGNRMWFIMTPRDSGKSTLYEAVYGIGGSRVTLTQDEIDKARTADDWFLYTRPRTECLIQTGCVVDLSDGQINEYRELSENCSFRILYNGSMRGYHGFDTMYPMLIQGFRARRSVFGEDEFIVRCNSMSGEINYQDIYYKFTGEKFVPFTMLESDKKAEDWTFIY